MDGSDQPCLVDLVAACGKPFACSPAPGMIQVSRAVKSRATLANSRLAADGWLTAAALAYHPATIGRKGGHPAAVVRGRAGTLVSGIL